MITREDVQKAYDRYQKAEASFALAQKELKEAYEDWGSKLYASLEREDSA